MSEQNFFRKLWLRIWPMKSSGVIAEQLRHPRGKLGKIVADKLNETNAHLYDFTFDTMEIEDGEHILELGFGNGKSFKKLLNSAKDLRVTGIDFSHLMVTTARRENEDYIDAGELEIVYSTSHALPFDADQFDKIFSINVVYFWDDPAESLREIYRVLKPGGKFYTSIRLKDTMVHFPYTKHGFTLYDEDSWKTLVSKFRFKYLSGTKLTEPDLEIEGAKFQMESICMVAIKPL